MGDGSDGSAATTVIMQRLLKEKTVEDIISVSKAKTKVFYILSSQPSERVLSYVKKSDALYLVKPLEIIHNQALFKQMLDSGKSLKLKKRLSSYFGLERYNSFDYSLKNLDSTKKQILAHALYGTGGRSSFLEKLKGKRLGKNNVLVPVEKASEMIDFFKTWKVKYEKRTIWLEKGKSN
jgi:hypothetical protein